MVLVSEVQVSFPDLAELFGALPENISVVCVLVRVWGRGVHAHACALLHVCMESEVNVR